jgi:hypothetical protein
MSLYKPLPLRNFYTFDHLVDSYRNTISSLAAGFRYGNYTLKLACGKKSLASHRPWEASFSSRGLILEGEKISILETLPI